MNNLIESLGLRDKVGELEPGEHSDDFEVVYSRLNSRAENRKGLEEIGAMVFDYFSAMELPPQPTLYDHLLLSMRALDLVATFNWDPLLFDSWERLRDRYGDRYLPSIAYLHGNVRVGYCPNHSVFGRNGRVCDVCNNVLTQTPLLYPIEMKNYDDDTFIADAWERLRFGLSQAFALTIFGYSAPVSDKAAMDAMKLAWKGRREREFETIFLVNTAEESLVKDSWREFLYSHHYRINGDFYDSLLPQCARRSVEALSVTTISGHFVDLLPIPREATWGELDLWFKEMISFEKDIQSSKK